MTREVLGDSLLVLRLQPSSESSDTKLLHLRHTHESGILGTASTDVFSRGRRELLERKTGALLLIAGVFLMIQIALETLRNSFGLTPQGGLPGWAVVIFSNGLFGLVGLAIPFIALLGLYHRLTLETPRLAVVGGALMALTPILFLTGFLTMLIPQLPDLPYLLWLSPLPYMMGAGSFGVAFLWGAGSIRFVGIPLLVFSGTWTLTFAVGLLTGGLPDQFPFVELLAVSIIAMGFLLYTDPTSKNNTALAGN